MYAAIKMVEYNLYRDHDAVDRVRVLALGDTSESAKAHAITRWADDFDRTALQQRCHQRRRAGPRTRLHRGRNAYPAAQAREEDDVLGSLPVLAAAARILSVTVQACACEAGLSGRHTADDTRRQETTSMNMDLTFDHGDVLGRLRASIKEIGGQSAFARQHGFSNSYLTDVLVGHRPVSDRLARALGFRRIVAYVAAEDCVDAA